MCQHLYAPMNKYSNCLCRHTMKTSVQIDSFHGNIIWTHIKTSPTLMGLKDKCYIPPFNFRKYVFIKWLRTALTCEDIGIPIYKR